MLFSIHAALALVVAVVAGVVAFMLAYHATDGNLGAAGLAACSAAGGGLVLASSLVG